MRVAPLVANLVLLLATASVILVVQLRDRSAFAIEDAVQRYADAVQRQDLDAAMQEIAPDQRPRWSSWVDGQLGNVYDVQGVAVHSPDLLSRWFQHASSQPTDATVSIDVNPGDPASYQANTFVPVEDAGAEWFLAEPLLAHEAVDEAAAD